MKARIGTILMQIYLASPYGFSEATRPFMSETLISVLKSHGHTVRNPWDLPPDLSDGLTAAWSIRDYQSRQTHLANINARIGERNEMTIRECDLVVAVLDGQEVDSGVAAEVGFACAIGKRIIGYRGDFRLSGENIGCRVNLQVQYFVEKSGGSIASSLEELEQQLTKVTL
jgi:nucleoside 2-deoxyribosyltransferase